MDCALALISWILVKLKNKRNAEQNWCIHVHSNRLDIINRLEDLRVETDTYFTNNPKSISCYGLYFYWDCMGFTVLVASFRNVESKRAAPARLNALTLLFAGAWPKFSRIAAPFLSLIAFIQLRHSSDAAFMIIPQQVWKWQGQYIKNNYDAYLQVTKIGLFMMLFLQMGIDERREYRWYQSLLPWLTQELQGRLDSVTFRKYMI